MNKLSSFSHALLSLGLFCLSALSHGAESAGAPASDGSPDGINARADCFRLDNPHTPLPGEALHHHTAGFAKILCSAVFVTGLDPEDAAANVCGFISPFEQRQHVVDTRIDRVREEVSLVLPDGVVRTARRYDNQGCVAHPLGEDSIEFTPSVIDKFASGSLNTLANGRCAVRRSLARRRGC